MSVKEEDPDFMKFARRTVVITGAILGVTGVWAMIAGLTPWAIAAKVDQERIERKAADDEVRNLLRNVVVTNEKLSEISEMTVVLLTETDPDDRRRVLAEMRRLRRVMPLSNAGPPAPGP